MKHITTILLAGAFVLSCGEESEPGEQSVEAEVERALKECLLLDADQCKTKEGCVPNYGLARDEDNSCWESAFISCMYQDQNCGQQFVPATGPDGACYGVRPGACTPPTFRESDCADVTERFCDN